MITSLPIGKNGESRTALTVGISELQISGDPNHVLVTYSLGSCVGLSLYDPLLHIGGLLHCMLPLSSIEPEKAQSRPGMFADTGVAALLEGVYRLGARSERLVAKVAGAANLLDTNGTFCIGKRNYAVVRKLLWKNSILIAAEDVGASEARTMYLDIASGQTFIRSNGRTVEL